MTIMYSPFDFREFLTQTSPANYILAEPFRTQRYGQWVVNELRSLHPNKYSEMMSSAQVDLVDPFYDDKKLPAFFKWLSQ